MIRWIVTDLLLICKKLVVLNRKWAPYILIGILLLALLLIKLVRGKEETRVDPTTTTAAKDPAGTKTNRDRGFDRRINYLQYSKHAICRMQCRKISQQEVEEIMQQGKINYNKSDLKSRRCPRYAVEGLTHDNQRVRIVYAQCNEATTVVTVIDLETDFECNCPGDNVSADAFYKNKNG